MKDHPWLSSYPPGVAKEIGPLQHHSLSELFEEASKKYADKIAFENMGVQLTFRQVDELSTAFGAYLQKDLGLKKGDRIAIQMPNLLQFPVCFLGALKAGLIVVNTNPLYTPREMEHQFRDSGASAVIIVANFAKNLEEVVGKLPNIKHVIITNMGDMLGTLKGALVNFVVKNVKKMVPAFNLPNAISFKSALNKGKSLKLDQPAIDVNDVALLQYTGGTTGVSKGAQLTHKNLIAHNQMCIEWFRPIMTADHTDIIITALPMYHIFALSVNGTLMYSCGVKNVLITNPRDIPGFCKELHKHKFTVITGVNTLFNGLLHNPDFKTVDFSHLRGAIGGGMAVQDVVAKKWEEVTGRPLVEGYGLSETSPLLCCNPLDGTQRSGTIGLPAPSTEIALFDDNGNEVAPGEAGEICARGPQVMPGYWQKDNAGVFFPGGWFRTGDIGVMDDKGFFRIVDRKKDMIKVSGFNVFPNEIENVIASNPKVLEVAAIGVPDAKSGEVIKVFVVKKDPSLTEHELIEYCHKNLTNYKVPKYVVFRDDLPKSNVGKIIRRILKEEDAKAKAA
jgi:long-chain acyl-CoA synthetase